MRQEPSATIWSALVRLVLIAALPVWLASGILLYKVQNDERSLLEREAAETANDVMVAIDLELTSARAAALVLASSAPLQTDHLSGFYAHATEALRSNVASNFVLSDVSGQQLVNTFLPYGASLPDHGDAELLRRVFANGQPQTSDLYGDLVSHRPVVSVDVPVMRDGKVVYDLSARLSPEHLHDILRRLVPHRSWQASLYDSRGIVVAHTEDGDQLTGVSGSVELVHAITNEPEGVVSVKARDGSDVYVAFARSDVSDWALAIEIMPAELNARLWKSLEISVGTTVVLVLMGLLAARIMSGRLARPIQALEHLARAHGRGEELDPPPLRLKEARDVARALVEGARQLANRTAERDRANEQRQRALIEKRLTDEDARTRSAYFAYLTHELGSPLMAVRALCDALTARLRKANPDEQSLRYSSRIGETAGHLANVVSEILDYARYEARELELNKEVLDAASEISEVVNMLDAEAERSGVRLTCQLPAQLPPLLADKKRLRQILFNLLSNAIKFTGADGTVTISAVADDKELAIRIRDTGPGISSEELPRVLRPFGQAARKDIKDCAGTGLGLPFSKGLAELHGGSLTLESARNEGTTVIVRLPLHPNRAGKAKRTVQRAMQY